jgi:hypothetical protein
LPSYFEASNPFKSFLLRYLVFNLNTIGDIHGLCLTCLAIFQSYVHTWKSSSMLKYILARSTSNSL